jgi:hypothetical protein
VAAAAMLALAAVAEAAAAPTPVAVGKPGQTALEFVGQVDQVGGSFTYYGYVTYVRGLEDPQLFTVAGVDQSEATARFTFYASTQMVRRAIIQNVFAVTSVGSFTVYLGSGGASFGNPSSFASGRAVATAALRLQNIINVQGAGPALGPPRVAGPGGPGPSGDLPQAISIGTGGAEQRSASTFTLAGKQYRFGRKGLDLRIFLAGHGVLLEPTAPRALLFLAGSAAVTR